MHHRSSFLAAIGASILVAGASTVPVQSSEPGSSASLLQLRAAAIKDGIRLSKLPTMELQPVYTLAWQRRLLQLQQDFAVDLQLAPELDEVVTGSFIPRD